MITRVAGWAARISAVAVMPSDDAPEVDNCTSIKTTSGLVCRDQRHRRRTVGRLADHLDIRRQLQQGDQGLPDQGLVVDQHDRDHRPAFPTRSTGSVVTAGAG